MGPLTAESAVEMRQEELDSDTANEGAGLEVAVSAVDVGPGYI